jgi:chromosome partitioning protein
VEKAVRKSGVGKTTTSINLAAAAATAGARVLLLDADPLSSISQTLNLSEFANRRLLRADGIDLPGVFCPGVVPGLDVLSPYGEGGCSDEQFDEVIRLVTASSPEGGYSCLVVDSPPFMGANPSQLLRSCDELILVMRAEAMAYRTLPAFLELVQRSRRDGRGVQMRGILLTLPDGELPGGRWERELRGRFGSRILPQVIPFDEEVCRAQEGGRVLTHNSPEASASVGYHALAETLALTSEEAGVFSGEGSPLLSAAAALDAAGVPLGRPAAALAAAAAPGIGSGSDVEESVTADADIALPPSTVPDSAEDTVHQPLPPSPPARRRPTPARPLPRARPAPVPADDDIPDLDELLARQALPRPSGRSGMGRSPLPARLPPAPPSASPPASRPPRPAAAPKSPPPPPAIPITSNQPWMVWVGLATVIGVGLRFVHLPDFMLPIAVGIAVAAAVILALKMVSPAPQQLPAPAPAQPALPPSSKRDVALPQPPAAQKPASHPGVRKDPNARLAALARRPASNPFPGQAARASEPPRSGDRRRRE